MLTRAFLFHCFPVSRMSTPRPVCVLLHASMS